MPYLEYPFYSDQHAPGQPGVSMPHTIQFDMAEYSRVVEGIQIAAANMRAIRAVVDESSALQYPRQMMCVNGPLVGRKYAIGSGRTFTNRTFIDALTGKHGVHRYTVVESWLEYADTTYR